MDIPSSVFCRHWNSEEGKIRPSPPGLGLKGGNTVPYPFRKARGTGQGDSSLLSEEELSNHGAGHKSKHSI